MGDAFRTSIGARFYTYMTTMAYVMEEAVKRTIRVVVLDRVNPINGDQIEADAREGDLDIRRLLVVDADAPRDDVRASWPGRSTRKTRLALTWSWSSRRTGAATTLDPTAHPRVTTEVSPP